MENVAEENNLTRNLILNIMNILRYMKIYIAPRTIYYDMNQDIIYTQVSPKVYDTYFYLWPEAEKRINNLTKGIKAKFTTEESDYQMLLLYHQDASPWLGREFTIDSFLNGLNPNIKNNFIEQIKKYLQSYRVEKKLVNTGIDIRTIIDRVLSHRIIVVNDAPSSTYEDINTPITISMDSEAPVEVALITAISSLVHEAIHFIDDVLGIATKPDYYYSIDDKLPLSLLDTPEYGIKERLMVKNKIPNNLKARITTLLKTLMHPKNEEEEQTALIALSDLFERKIKDRVGVDFNEFVSILTGPGVSIDSNSYKSNKAEFYANVNMIDFLRAIGLNKQQIERLFVQSPNSNADLPKEWIEYARSAGWDLEKAIHKFHDTTNPNSMPFEILWDYSVSPTIEERQLQHGQQRIHFAKNWYSLFKKFN